MNPLYPKEFTPFSRWHYFSHEGTAGYGTRPPFDGYKEKSEVGLKDDKGIDVVLAFFQYAMINWAGDTAQTRTKKGVLGLHLSDLAEGLS